MKNDDVRVEVVNEYEILSKHNAGITWSYGYFNRPWAIQINGYTVANHSDLDTANEHLKYFKLMFEHPHPAGSHA